MIKLPTLVLGTTLGLAALGLSGTAAAGVRVGVDVGLPVVAPAVVAPAVVPAPAVVAYRPAPYYGPYFYGGSHRYFGPGWGHPHGPVAGWRGGYRGGWHR